MLVRAAGAMRADGQDRTRGEAENFRRNGAEHYFGSPGAAAGSNYDQVDGLCMEHLIKLIPQTSGSNDEVMRDAGKHFVNSRHLVLDQHFFDLDYFGDHFRGDECVVGGLLDVQDMNL